MGIQLKAWAMLSRRETGGGHEGGGGLNRPPIPPFAGESIGLSMESGPYFGQKRRPTELDRFTNPISPQTVLRLRRLPHLLPFSGSVPRK